MKKFISLIFCILFIVSCASIQREITVKDNIFYSSYPPNAIKVDPEIKYLGKVDKSEFRNFEGRLTGPTVRSDSYVFVQIIKNRINKAVVIKIDEINEGYWLPDLFEKVKTKLVSGVTKINNDSYQYIITNSIMANDLERKFVTDKGYITSNCYLWKALGTILAEQVRFVILYAEEFSNNDKLKRYKCVDWNKTELLLEDQKEFLREFNLRADKNIKILPVSDLPKYTEELQGENDLEQKLIKLKELFEKGLLTQQEYDKKKEEILNRY